MMPFTWNNDWDKAWDTGLPLIDNQHHELFRRMADFSRSLASDQSQLEGGKILIHMRQYVDFHFTTEEFVMMEKRYPDFETHRAAHDHLRDQVDRLTQAFLRGQPLVPQKIMDLLGTWLVDHLASEDRALARFLQDLEAGVPGA
jgi:hemerythrin